MTDEPRCDELLRVARRVLLDELLPVLPEGKKYNCLMVANVMAIAVRELEQGEASAQAVSRSVQEFFRHAGLREAGMATEATLAEAIRMQDIPESHMGDLQALLLAITHIKLAISNPKHARVDHDDK